MSATDVELANGEAYQQNVRKNQELHVLNAFHVRDDIKLFTIQSNESYATVTELVGNNYVMDRI